VPIFKHHTSLQIMQSIRAFLVLYRGFHRGSEMDLEQELKLAQAAVGG
jgi:hypothetical protein